MWCLAVASLLAAGQVFVSSAAATHSANVFSGTWTTNIGGVSFRVVSNAEGAAALRALGGQPCGGASIYYHGDYNDRFGTGRISACTVARGHVAGRYIENRSTSAQGDGGIDLRFVAPNRFSGFYTGNNFPGQTFPYTGAFQNHFAADRCCAVARPAPKKKKKRKRKSRRNSCPAPRSSAAHAAVKCHWYVDYLVQQRGDPFRSEPAPTWSLADTETLAVGKVFFSAEPRRGRVARGSPSGLVVHTDTHQSPVNPFLFDEGDVTAKPDPRKDVARYRFGDGTVSLEVTMTVTGVTGFAYANDYEAGNAQAGDNAALFLRSEPPLHQDDLADVQVICRLVRCHNNFRLLHRHRYRAERENKLRVRISRPRPLR